MTRKTSIFTATSERDKGKVFLITEMSASNAEDWAMRAMMGALRAGVEIPEDIASAGLAGMAVLGAKAIGLLDVQTARELMAEMFACISIVPDPSRPKIVRTLIEDDIEDIATRVELRKAVLGLHLDFFQSAAPSTSGQGSAEQMPGA